MSLAAARRTIFGVSVVGLLLSLSLLNCGHCTPVPTPPVVDAAPDNDAPKDIFYGITADCSLPVVAQQSAGIMDSVRTCLDVTNTGPCLVGLADRAEKDTIVCVVQQFDMELHAAMARGTANDAMKAQAERASGWIRAEGVGIRN